MLANRIATLYPTAALMARLIPPKSDDIHARLERLRPLMREDKTLFGKNVYFNTEGFSKAEAQSLQEDYSSLMKISNIYPGLDIASLLNDSSLSITDKANTITNRIGVFNRFVTQNSEVELVKLNYSHDSVDIPGLNFSGMAQKEQIMALDTCKAYQRIYSVSSDPFDAKAILEAGYASATDIATDTIDSLRNSIGIEPSVADTYYSTARAKLGTAVTFGGTIFDYVHGGFDLLAVSNTQKDIGEYLKQINGYSELFGNQSYCSCQHCQSIVSPAAYFVDLMKFVEDHVSTPYFIKTGKENHPLSLKNRRPDLWTLELTCSNTLDEIPNLEIINDILEDYIANELGGYAPPELKGHDKAEYIVYTNLSRSLNSFYQPVNLPLVKLILYLSHFDRSRAEIARTLGEKADVIAGAVLNVSRMEYDSIITPETDLNVLSILYINIGFELLPGPGFIKPIDVQLLLKAMGITRDEVDELCQTLPYPVIIQSEKIDPDNSIQNDIEKIYNLTPQLLDYMHRFVRLWRHLPWSMGELHLILSSLGDPSMNISTTVEHLPDVLTLQKTLGLTVEESCGLWSILPQEAIGKNRDSFFNQLFNPPSMKLLKKPFPKSLKFIHPSFNQGDPSEETMNALHRLRAGLRVSDEDFFLLITYLSEPLGLKLEKPNPADNSYGFELNPENLTLLYRHATFAKSLRLSVPDLFQLIEFAILPKKFIQDIKGCIALLELHTWWRSSGYSLNDLGYVTHGNVRKKETYPDADAVQKKLVAIINDKKSLEFPGTTLAFIQGISEAQSREIIESNVKNPLDPSSIGLFEKTTTPDYRIIKEFTEKSKIFIPDSISKHLIDSKISSSPLDTENQIRNYILMYHASQIIPVILGEILNISVKKT